MFDKVSNAETGENGYGYAYIPSLKALFPGDLVYNNSVQLGFIRPTSGADANGKYAVIVFWEALADADASIAAFQVDPTVADYFGMIDGNTFLAERFSIFNE